MERGQTAEVSILKALFFSFLFCNGFVILKSIFSKRVANKLFTPDNPNYQKAQNCIFKIMFYGFISIYGYLVLTAESWSGDRSKYYLTLGPQPYSPKINFYYIIEFSFYLTELQFLITQYKNKDRAQLICHHLVTISLIVVSYLKDYVRVGVVIMGLHDVADPILECCKLFIYLEKFKSANVGFCMFTLVFVSSRIFFFPYWIIYPVVRYMINKPSPSIDVCSLCLCALYLLHVYWTCMIYKTFKKIFIKNEYKDARSESVLSTQK